MSSRSTSGSTTTSTVVGQKQDSQHSFKKKPPPLDMKITSQESTTTTLPSASSGQKTPPILSNGEVGSKDKKIGHRRVNEQTGEVTYKKKATSDLMTAIQLGIGQSVGSLTSKPTRDVLMQDFSVVETVHFPENGSNLTPAHRAGEFKFKTYAPIAFRYFRELFGIQTDDFLISLASLPLKELSNPGASGSVFFITEDDEFIIKTVQHKEADFLQKLLPGYYMNLNQNPRTLLPKFYGLYCLQTGGKNIRLCVMNNLLPQSIPMSEKYDLKGSTYKRKASKHELAKSSPTFKDLDFRDRNPDGILLEADTYDALMKTLKRDCRVLESFKIMDYSLLLAAHNVDEQKRRRQEQRESLESALPGNSRTPLSPVNEQPSTSDTTSPAGAEARYATPAPVTRARSTKARLAHFSTAMESIQADTEPVEVDDEDVPPGGIPARNAKGERLLLYAGVIDILQSYRLKKKLEHGFKSIVHDGDSISVHRPSFYATRFLTFFEKEVFRKVNSLDSPTVTGRNARFRKIVHTVSLVVQMKRLPAFQHVMQPDYSSQAIRSPSKKKTTRQRSLTDPSGAEQHTVSHGASGGGVLHSSKPDLIPQQTSSFNDETARPTSSHTFSDRSGNYTVSHQSSTSTAGTAGALPVTTAPLRDTHTPPPPHHDDPLPPYSEKPQSFDKVTSTAIAGGARSKFSATVQTTSSVGIETAAGVDTGEITLTQTRDVSVAVDESVQTIVPPVENTGNKQSSFRRDNNRPEMKKGVRFSANEDDEELSPPSDLTDSGLTPIPTEAPTAEGTSDARPTSLPESEDGYAVLKHPVNTTSDISLKEQINNTLSDHSHTNTTTEVLVTSLHVASYNTGGHTAIPHVLPANSQPTTDDSMMPQSANTSEDSMIDVESDAQGGEDAVSPTVVLTAGDGVVAAGSAGAVEGVQKQEDLGDEKEFADVSVDSTSIELRIIEDDD